VYTDPAQPIEARVEDLLSRMTLAEKVGQMTQVDRAYITPDQVRAWAIGSVLSGGGSTPPVNTPASWAAMVDGFQQGALSTRLAIPIMYGIDAVHGNGAVFGATVFPHNIGLGAADDPALVERIGQATAAEMAATGMRWDFAPMVAVPTDIRWGRTYEAYSEDPAIVSALGAAFIDGLQRSTGKDTLTSPTNVVATVKHYLGDGAAEWGTSAWPGYEIDQGDTSADEADLLRHNLSPYQAAIAAGVRAVMVSFSSWQGTKMHAQHHLLTEVLKGELGFDGIVLSDWGGINQISSDYTTDVVTSINAGIDMVMVPDEFVKFIQTLISAVARGDVPMTRIDDAVRRILRVKFESGLFERPYTERSVSDSVGSQAHRDVAREAVQRSLVLLKNDDQVLPLARTEPVVLVAGAGADDIGLQSGGWTITHQGAAGNITPGTTILDGIKRTIDPGGRVEYDPTGRFEQLLPGHDSSPLADVGIVVLAEAPYAEGLGDRADLTLPPDDQALLARVRPLVRKLVVVLLSGRPLVVTQQLPSWDAFVAAWLPGTEGQGVADVLFGDKPFTGHLPYTWPRWTNQLPFKGDPPPGCGGPLFLRGDGLRFGDPSPVQLECQQP
jgi:beta-glucosidase